MPAFYRTYDLPWTPGEAGEQRFRRILRNVLVAYAVIAVVLPFLPLPERERAAQPELPERVVQLIVEQPKPPPPPPPAVEQPKPEVKVAKVEAPKPQPVPVQEQPVDRREQAREKARNAGLLALQDELADLRDDDVSARLAGNRQLSGAVGEAAVSERSLITSKAGRGSGGINTASMSRNTGGAALAGRDTTRVESTVASAASAEAPVTGDGRPSRSREEIEMVFDQNKGAIYALYSRALRKDPTLQGKLVLKLTIEPGGAVSACEVVSTELQDDELLQKLIARVKMFRFPDRDVAQVTTTKPIDFFPA